MPEEPIQPVGQLRPLNAPKPTGKLKPFNPTGEERGNQYQQLAGEGLGSYNAFGAPTSNVRDIINNIPDINDGERDILNNMAESGKADQINDAILTFQRAHPKQQSDVAGEKGFYYMKDGVPVPLNAKELPPAGYKVASVFGTPEEAQDDSWYTSLAKTAFNIFPKSIGGVADLMQTGYEAVTGQSSDALNKVHNRMQSFSLEKKEHAPLYDFSNISKWADVADPKRFDLSPEAIYGTALELGESVGEMIVTGKPGANLIKSGGKFWVKEAVDGAKKLTTAGKLATTGFASTVVNLGEVREAGREAGLEGRDLALFSGPVAMAMAAIDMKLGLGSKILERTAVKQEKNAFVKGLMRDALEKSPDGTITKEAIDEALKATQAGYGQLASRWLKETGKDALSQGADEALQDVIKTGGQQLWDNLTPAEKKKFGTDAASPEAFGSYLSNFMAGMIGGAPTALALNKVKQVERDRNASQSVYGIVQQGPQAWKDFKDNARLELQRGELTQDQYNDAVTRANAYKEYNDILGGTRMEDKKKLEVFEKTFQKQNLESQMEAMGDPTKLHPLRLGEYNSMKKMSEDLQKDINTAVQDARLNTETVVGSKTVDDAIKREQKLRDDKKKTNPDGSKKPAVSEALKALKERFGMKITPAQQKLDADTKAKSFEDLSVNQYNDRGYNTREKHQVTYDYLNKQPDQQVTGVIDREAFQDKKGKLNSVLLAKFGKGHRLKFASSMIRDMWGRGWTAIGNRPRALMTQDDAGYWHLDDKKVIGAPIGMKAVTIKDDNGADKPAIKVFYAGEGEDYGKFIGWAKKTHRGEKVSEKEQVQYEEEEKRIEPRRQTPPAQQVAPTPVSPTPIEPVSGPPPAPYKNQPGQPVPAPSQTELEEKALAQNLFDTSPVRPFQDEKNNFKPGDNIVRVDFGKGKAAVYLVVTPEERADYREKAQQAKKAGAQLIIHPLRDTAKKYRDQFQGEDVIVDLVADPFLRAPKPKLDLTVENNENEKGTESNAAGEQKVEAGNNNQAVQQNNRQREGEERKAALREKVTGLIKKIRAFNSLPKREKQRQEEFRIRLLNEAKELGLEIKLQAKQNLALINDKGKKIIGPKSKTRSKEVRDEEAYKKDFQKRALNNEPVSLRHAVIMDMANGVQFDKRDLIARSGVPANEVPALMATYGKKGKDGTENNKDATDGVKFETYAQRMRELAGINNQAEDVDDEAIANEAADIVASFAQKGWRQDAIDEAEEILERQENNGMTRAEIEAMEAAQRMNEVAEGDQKAKEEGVEEPVQERINWMEYMDEEELEAMAEEQDLYDDYSNAIESGDKDTFIEYNKRLLKHTADYDEENEEFYNDYFGKMYDRAKAKNLVLQKKAQHTGGNIQKVVDVIKKAFPKVKVQYDPNLDAAGELRDGTIYINPYYAGEATPIHEAAHVMIDAIGYDNKVIQAAIKQLQGTDLWRETADRYPELDEKGLNIEVLAEAIGREGEGIWKDQAEKSKFRQYLEYIYDWLKQKLGVDKNVAKSLAKQIIGGVFTKDMQSEAFAQQKPSLEIAYAQEQHDKAKRALKELKKELKAKYKELGITYQEDQEDLFGERQSQAEPSLFDERVDASATETATKDIRDRITKAAELEKTTREKLDELKNKPDPQTSLFQKKDPKFDAYREKVLGRDLEEEQQAIDFIEEQLDNDELSDEDIEVLENARQAIIDQIQDDRSEYAEYKDAKQKAQGITSEEDLDQYSMDDLVALYRQLKDDDESTNEVKRMITDKIMQEQIKILEKTDPDIREKINKNDMTFIESWMKNLNDINEKFPLLQGLNRAFDKQYLAKTREANARKKKLRQLGKAVIREKNGLLGLGLKDGFLSNNAKYFDFVEDNGKLRTNTSGLTHAQKEFLDFYSQLVDERKEILTDGETLDNGLLKADKGFWETALDKKEGWLYGLNVMLGGNDNLDATVAYRDPQTGKRVEKSYQQAQQDILDAAKESKSIAGTAKAIGQLFSVGYQAKKSQRKIKYSGELRSKFSEEHKKSYSKDFYKGAMDYIDESAHYKHMRDLAPVVDAIESFYRNISEPGKSYENTERFLKEWKTNKLYHGRQGHDPIIDAAISFLRHATSTIVMAFNTPANLLNVAIGNYNTMRDDNLMKWGQGQVRLFSNLRNMMEKVNHYDVVGIDYDSNPRLFAGRLLDMIAHAGMRWGEVQIQASQFLGKLTDAEYKALKDAKLKEDGTLELTPPPGMTREEFDEKMIQYRNEVSDVQGKYSEKDRRNFMNYEAYKAAGQFKVWVPDWWKQRFGKEFIDSRGNLRRGTWRMFTGQAFKEFRDEIKNNPSALLNSDSKSAKDFRSNVKGAMVVAALLIATHSNDDDDKRRKKVLSLQNGLNNMLFIFDPEQLKWTIQQPFAIQGTLGKFIDVLQDVMHGDTGQLPKDLKKVIPYNKILDVPETFTK